MKKIILVLFLGFLIPLNAGSVLATIDLGFSPADQNVYVGTSANVALTISGLGNFTAPSLGTFDLNVTFDPSILSFKSVLFGDPVLGDQLDLFGLGANPTFAGTVGPGSLNLFELSFDSPSELNSLQAGSFTLANISFDTFALGNSLLGISLISLGDADGNALSATLNGGSISVKSSSQVPESSSLLLVLNGIAGLVFIRKFVVRSF
jgi:hypothetical protein